MSATRNGPRVTTRPFPIKRALPFVREVHRRLPKIQGAMWAVAALIEGAVVGVAVVGHPQARMACDGVSLEVTRVAVKEGAKNACSALYASCSRAARAMGAEDLWTSIHADETGHSLRAAGWVEIGPCGGGAMVAALSTSRGGDRRQTQDQVGRPVGSARGGEASP